MAMLQMMVPQMGGQMPIGVTQQQQPQPQPQPQQSQQSQNNQTQ